MRIFSNGRRVELDVTDTGTAVPRDKAAALLHGPVESDNGLGIAPEHHARVFELFQRLHGPEDYSGIGMGLAVCNTIVKDHGGRMWAENAPGGGARFTFTLPVPQDDHEGNTHHHY